MLSYQGEHQRKRNMSKVFEICITDFCCEIYFLTTFDMMILLCE